MDIGIFVTQDKYANKIVDITRSALKRGYQVKVFMTDSGVKLVRNNDFTDLRNNDNISISLCDFSARAMKVEESEIAEGIIMGTQFQNASIHSDCDKILVF